jgi:cardiolipin synthase
MDEDSLGAWMRLRAPSGGSERVTKVLAGVGAASLAFYGAKFLLNFFGPTLPYSLSDAVGCELDSEEFLEFLSTVTDGTVRESRLTRLKNGVEFYPAELEAIRGAKRAINLEFYEFMEGEVSREMLDALAERASAGVEVRVLVDAVGSFTTPDGYFEGLRRAGGRMCWYHPVRWNTWQMVNNRSHRKLLVVDGKVGFIGGAGVADHWLHATSAGPTWRDTMFRVEGSGVAGLISTFAENWLEAAGEILAGPAQFDFTEKREGARSFVVISTPHGGSTQTRILFQALITSAKQSIRITTPYFLPDRSARGALIEAVRRGVKVQILTAGPHIDHPTVKTLSQNSSRSLLRAGAEIFKYQPAMIHAKLMTVDEQWNVVGSTNFDHRSFALNDEVNLAIYDAELARTLREDFEDDLRQSKPLTLAMLEKRAFLRPAERLIDHAIEQES